MQLINGHILLAAGLVDENWEFHGWLCSITEKEGLKARPTSLIGTSLAECITHALTHRPK